MKRTELLVVAVQAGAREVLPELLARLPRDWELPVVVACPRELGDDLHGRLWATCALPVLEPNDKDLARPGQVLLSPPGYQLLLDDDQVVLAPQRPEEEGRLLDRLLQSVAASPRTLGLALLLRAGGSDGEEGIAAARAAGGHAIVVDVDPNPAEISPIIAGVQAALGHPGVLSP